MRRVGTLAVFALAVMLPASRAVAQAKLTTAQKIANASSAAPSSISAKASILDWPATEGGKPVTLRAGTNGWTCFPDFPMSQGNDPMCLDESWTGWMTAMMAKTPPHVTRPGIGYMIAPGGAYGSNTDPYAMKKTADNDWGYDPPHLMLIFPDASALQGIPTKRQNGGPWAMWTGTPYAHVMVPLSAPKP